MSFGKAVILGSFLASSQQASEWPDYSSRLGVETRGTWTIVRGCRFEGSAILLTDVCGLGGWTIANNLGEECGRGHRATPALAARLSGDAGAGAGRRGCGYGPNPILPTRRFIWRARVKLICSTIPRL
jgi:hypothetical protein